MISILMYFSPRRMQHDIKESGCTEREWIEGRLPILEVEIKANRYTEYYHNELLRIQREFNERLAELNRKEVCDGLEC